MRKKSRFYSFLNYNFLTRILTVLGNKLFLKVKGAYSGNCPGGGLIFFILSGGEGG